MRLTLTFDRLGPYHVARLNALAQRCDLTVVELREQDSVYAWDKVTDGCRFERRTLFGAGLGEGQIRRRLPGALAQALQDSRPDAVGIPGWDFQGPLSALYWCLRRGVPAILMTESQGSDYERQAAKEWLKSLVVRRFSSALVGGRRSAYYTACLGVPRDRIFPGYDVVDNAHFEQGADKARADGALRQALGLPPRYWLASARFVPQKNLATLLGAYARYADAAGPAAYGLVLLGDGPLKPELLALRRNLGLEAQVQFPGFIQYQQLPAYYGLASAFVHASTIEPWGLVVNEAMAARLPVLVSSACGCAPELVYEGVNGWTFDPEDKEALVQGLKSLQSQGTAGLVAMGLKGQDLMRLWSPALFGANMVKAAEAALSAPRQAPAAPARLMVKALAMAR
jgi:1,2-diacylglycerol 3-alpha-glucosyltransferase